MSDLSKSQHTPTPWSAEEPFEDPGAPSYYAKCQYLRGSDGTFPALMCSYPTTEQTIANGNLIVRAVNAHEALVEALEEMTEQWHHMIGISSPPDWHRLNEKARAALALAKGDGE